MKKKDVGLISQVLMGGAVIAILFAGIGYLESYFVCLTTAFKVLLLIWSLYH
jgi:hypothetical protein